MKNKYDLIFSLGAACSSTSTLRYANLQFCSYPLDWLYGASFSERMDILLSEFHDFINKDDLVALNIQNGDKSNPCDVYKNTRTGIVFNHDFPAGINIDDSFPSVKEKYNRRINRLLGDILKSEKILIVYIETPAAVEKAIDDKTLIENHEKLLKKYPEKKIDLYYIRCSSEEKTEDISDSIKKIYFDYKSKKENDVSYAVDRQGLRSALNNISLKQNLFQSFYHFLWLKKKKLCKSLNKRRKK